LLPNIRALESWDTCSTSILLSSRAHVFYPVAEPDQCEIALLLDVDPIGLVRKGGPSGNAGALEQYVNDRPYVASSFLSVAIAEVFGSALNGRSKDRPDLVESAFPFVAKLAVLPCRGGEPLLRKLFEPLGYQVEARRLPLDTNFPEWGESAYYSVELRNTTRLQDLLGHLYVLIPVSRATFSITIQPSLRLARPMGPSTSRPPCLRHSSARRSASGKNVRAP
jgi:3' terminal RNA ribose 2'-O-methyltransferase Hen1